MVNIGHLKKQRAARYRKDPNYWYDGPMYGMYPDMSGSQIR